MLPTFQPKQSSQQSARDLAFLHQLKYILIFVSNENGAQHSLKGRGVQKTLHQEGNGRMKEVGLSHMAVLKYITDTNKQTFQNRTVCMGGGGVFLFLIGSVSALLCFPKLEKHQLPHEHRKCDGA